MECKVKSNISISVIRLIKMVFQKGRGYIVLQLFLRILCGLLPAMTALLWQYILQIVNIEQTNPLTTINFIALAIVGGLSASYFYFTAILDTLIRNKTSIALQKEVHKTAAQLPMNDYESDELIDMLDRAGKIFCYGDAVGFIMTVFGIIQQTVSLIAIIISVWSFHPALTAGAFLLVIPGIVRMILNKKRIDFDFKLSPKRREVGVLSRYLTGKNYIKDMYMMNTGQFFLDKWIKANNDVRKEEKKINRKITMVRIITDLIEYSVTIISYGMCLFFVVNKIIDIASFGALIVLIGQFIQNSTLLINQINGIQGEALSIHRAIGYFELGCDKREKNLSSIEQIKLNNVSYLYPGSTYCAVNNINLEINKGEIVVIVGQNGSGKTTLSKLILGLIKPSFGGITANGKIMDEIEYSSLYKHYSAVFQDYNRYATTVRNNIVISNSENITSDEKIYKLLSDMGIDFIINGGNMSLEKELGVEYGGTDLSGGQWQQLAIARAAFKVSKVVVLDEPSSALDPLREAELFNTFKEICKNKIGVIISHRLGICALADKIIVMADGKIVESGTLKDLLNENGDFAELYISQRNMYKA